MRSRSNIPGRHGAHPPRLDTPVAIGNSECVTGEFPLDYRAGLLLFELMKYFSCCPVWACSLRRLDGRLFSMMIASACGALLHNPA
jgi:hypothetical protein